MGILTVDETKLSGRLNWSVDGGRNYTLQVRIVTDDVTIGPRAAALACNMDVGSPYRFPLTDPTEVDYGSTLTGVSVEKEADDGKSYIISMEFTQRKPTDQDGAQADNTFTVNPVLAPPAVRWGSERMEIACIYDRTGKPIVNAGVGDPFDPPLTRPYTVPIVNVTRTLTTFDPNWVFDYQDHINEFDWLGFPAGTVLCKELAGNRVFHSDYGWLWEQVVAFAFKPIRTADDGTIIENGWAEVILNTGLREKVDGKIRKVIVDNSPVNSPVPLTSKGKYDPDDEQGYVVFDIYPTADFAAFDLPEDLFTITGGV
jgi:hypothetical protein